MLVEYIKRLIGLNAPGTHAREVARGALIASVLKATTTGLSFVFNLLLARLLGVEGTGIYYLALTVTSIATVFGRLGLDNAIVRFVAASAAKGQWHQVAGLYRRGIGVAAGASLLVTGLVFSLAPTIAHRFFSEPDLVAPLRVMALAVTPMSLLLLHGEMLRGLKRIRDAMVVQGACVSAISLALLPIFARTLGVLGVAIVYVLAASVTLGLAIYLWGKATPQLSGVSGHFDMKTLINSSLPLFWVALMTLVMGWTDTVMLGVWTESTSVGIYGVAVRIATLTSFVIVAVNSIIAPKFSELYAVGDQRTLGELSRKAAKVMTLVATPVLLLCILFPSWLLGWFGPAFKAGAASLSILAAGQFVNVATGSVGYLLMMSGHEKLMRNNIMFSAMLNLLLNACLIPRWGMVGAAIATASSLAVMNLVSTVLVYKKLAIFTLPLPKGICLRETR